MENATLYVAGHSDLPRGHFEAILGQLYIVCESGVMYIFIHLQLCTHVWPESIPWLQSLKVYT